MVDSETNYCEACQSGERLDLRGFFPYMGAKWLLALNYSPPEHDLIVEPFAGSAGYSVTYHRHNVLLIEKDKTIAEVWKFLISSREEEILDIPILNPGDLIRDHIEVPAIRHLVGLWTQFSPVYPSPRIRNTRWNEKTRKRVARQVKHIKHWNVIEGDFLSVENFKATWFIDPPYLGRTGEWYRQKRSQILGDDLVEFCISRAGQVIVCESEIGDYLPFESLYSGMSIASKREHEQCVFYLESN